MSDNEKKQKNGKKKRKLNAFFKFQQEKNQIELENGRNKQKGSYWAEKWNSLESKEKKKYYEGEKKEEEKKEEEKKEEAKKDEEKNKKMENIFEELEEEFKKLKREFEELEEEYKKIEKEKKDKEEELRKFKEGMKKIIENL